MKSSTYVKNLKLNITTITNSTLRHISYIHNKKLHLCNVIAMRQDKPPLVRNVIYCMKRKQINMYLSTHLGLSTISGTCMYNVLVLASYAFAATLVFFTVENLH